ncbi:MAG: type II toxin-antitoxin system death-on-curing family toxin [Bryobacterales bacterium]|jgi:death-on-curing protein|nr:type II toxin-antitoxin system death-on-curing family toxin [Bryobacterales bacterium]
MTNTGREAMTDDTQARPVFLTLKEVMDIHDMMVRRYGGRRGIRDSALLESALTMPRCGIVGQYLHTDLFEMAAAYLFHFCRNRPFHTANDPTAVVAALVFLRLNGIGVTGSPQELADLVSGVVQQKAGKEIISWFFRSHSHTLAEGPLPHPVDQTASTDESARDKAS